MRKHLTLLAAAILALTALVSCQKNNTQKIFHLTGGKELSIQAEGGYTLFGIEANPTDTWSINTDADWLDIRQSFGEPGIDDAVFMLWAEPWIYNETRTATVTVTGPNGVFTKTVTQLTKPVPDEPIAFENEVASEGSALDVEIPMGYAIHAVSDVPWITVTACTEGLVSIAIEKNPDPGNERTGTVTVYLSDEAVLAIITVTQKDE